MTRRRIQPRPAVELETITLRLPAELVRAVDAYARHLGGSSDRTYVIAQAIELALGNDDGFRSGHATQPDRPGSPAAPAE